MLKKICLSLGSIILCLVLCEIVIRVFSVVGEKEREKFVTDNWQWPLTAIESSDGPLRSAFVAHPYWGVTSNPSRFGMNDMGFEDSQQFPYQRREKETVVALLGGSVAQALHPHLQKAIESELSKSLPKNCKPNVKVMNLAIATLKQPAQFHIYNYFSDDFDFAVNVDGYNDAFLASSKDSPQFYPLFYNELFLLGSKRLAQVMRTYRLAKIKYDVLQSVRDNRWWMKSDLVFWITDMIFKAAEKANQHTLQQIRNPLHTLPIPTMEKNVRWWSKYIVAQNTLSQKDGKTSFFFLQPSQYAEPQKPLSEAEARDYEKDPERLEMLRSGYRLLSKTVAALKKKNIFIADLSTLYTKTSDERFTDNCCHINDLGNQELALAVAQKILPQVLKRHQCAP